MDSFAEQMSSCVPASNIKLPPADGKSSSPTPSLTIAIKVRGRLQLNRARVSQLAFSRGDTRLAALSRHRSTVPATNNRRWQRIEVYNATTLASLYMPNSSGHFENEFKAFAENGAPALAFGPETVAEEPKSSARTLFSRKDKGTAKQPEPSIPLLFLHGKPNSITEQHGQYDVNTCLAIIDVGGMKRSSHVENVSIEVPIAINGDGTCMVGRSAEDPTEMYIMEAGTQAAQQSLKTLACLPGHLAAIKQVAFMPDGHSVVSLAEDGTGRITSYSGSDTGKTLYKCRIDHHGYSVSHMQVSPTGKFVASVWGRQVVRWYPETDSLLSYNLDAVRPVELWPLAFSADACLLVCRTENGIDIVRVEDGTSAGHLNWAQDKGNFATAAAFSSNGQQLAVGFHNGLIFMHDLSYIANTEINQEASEEAPPTYAEKNI